jgi:hypothetical protein
MAVKLSNYVPASEKGIKTLEKALGKKLPIEYINFLLSFNAAKPETNIFSISKDSECGVDKFISYQDILKETRLIEHISEDMIPIAWAEGGNYILQNIENGKIFFWDHEIPEKQIELALNISEFLKQLEPFDLSSVELKDGQVKSAWIDEDFLKNL